MNKKPNQTTTKVLVFCARYCQAHGGQFPTVREIMRGADIASTSTVAYHLRRLAAAGRLAGADGKRWLTDGKWRFRGEVPNGPGLLDPELPVGGALEDHYLADWE